jgi:hypothetical protein
MRAGKAIEAISFEGELPLPEVNLLLYRRIYVVEQWLRRIALAALMARYGSRWGDAIPTEIGKNLKARVAGLRNRVAFDTENSDNVIWCLTLEELRSLLTYEKTWSYVKEMTSFDRLELDARLDDLREIRNVIGHNRAATDYTLKVFEAIDEALWVGIGVFRDRLLYDFGGTQHLEGLSGDPVGEAFYASHSPLGREQMAGDRDFYYLYALRPDPSQAVRLGDLLEHFNEVRRTILAFLINRQTPGEYTIVWPRNATTDEHTRILDRFRSYVPGPGLAYGLQNPKYVCHPKVWFVY